MLAVLMLERMAALAGGDEEREPMPMDAFMPYRSAARRAEMLDDAASDLASLRGLPSGS